jgi:hypothetical protein
VCPAVVSHLALIRTQRWKHHTLICVCVCVCIVLACCAQNVGRAIRKALYNAEGRDLSSVPIPAPGPSAWLTSTTGQAVTAVVSTVLAVGTASALVLHFKPEWRVSQTMRAGLGLDEAHASEDLGGALMRGQETEVCESCFYFPSVLLLIVVHLGARKASSC